MGARRPAEPAGRRAGAGLQRHLLRRLPQSRRAGRGRAGRQEHRAPECAPDTRLDSPRRPRDGGPPAPPEPVETAPHRGHHGTTTTTTVEIRPLSIPCPRSSPGAPSGSEKLAEFHPGFKTSSSVVLHRFGTNPDYVSWRSKLTRSGVVPASATRPTADAQGEMRQLQREIQLAAITVRRSMPIRLGGATIVPSERNTTPLFGAGLIDAIPAREIVAAGVGAGPSVRVPRDPRARLPPQGRPDRPVRLEGADGEPRRFRPQCLRRRARARGPRASAGARPPGTRGEGEGARPDRRRVRRTDRLRGESPGAGRAGARRGARDGPDRAGPRPVRFDRLRHLPPPGAGRGEGTLQRPAAARHGPEPGRQRRLRRQRPRFLRRGSTQRVAPGGRRNLTDGGREAIVGANAPGMADAAALGPPRLGPLSPRRPGRDPRAGDRAAWRRGAENSPARSSPCRGTSDRN